MTRRVIEERQGFPGALRALGGVGGLGFSGVLRALGGVRGLGFSGALRALGGVGGHFGAPHLEDV